MNFKEYLKEISIVILGILIAFWISNVGMNYKEHTIQKQVFLTILNELKENNKNVEVTMRSLDTLRLNFTRIQKKTNVHGEMFVTISYSGLDVKGIGYETAKNTGILKDIDYKLVSRIVENYESQNSLKELENRMSDELFVLIKNKIGNRNNLDYVILQITNLMTNLTDFDAEQKQLIEDLTVYLDVKS
ncbi:MAG TPA: hypothetical protein VMW01_05855 [Williamwhitmania sp.]|nr:hypothetical protein [Williamwhitmania sp.]